MFRSSSFDKPWRDDPWLETEKDCDYVKRYEPQSQAKHLRILLIGSRGSGKSSFINSVDSALRGKIGARALVATDCDGCFTKEYRSYTIQAEKPGTFYPLVFSDTMGIEKGSGTGIDVKNIKLIMEGHVNDGCMLHPGSTPTGSDYNQTPTINDIVHVLVYVVDARTVHMDDDVVLKIKNARQEARALRIPQIVILTKIDEASSMVKKNIKNVYKSKTLKLRMEQLSGDLGLPMNCIFPVKNYSIETKTDENTDTLILNTMRKIIDYGEDFLNDIAPTMAITQPEQPEKPEQREQHVKPVQHVKPEQPEKPEQPVKPQRRVKPEQPVEPECPQKPKHPVKRERRVKPEQPVKLKRHVEAEQPEKPKLPVRPEQSEKPGKPVSVKELTKLFENI